MNKRKALILGGSILMIFSLGYWGLMHLHRFFPYVYPPYYYARAIDVVTHIALQEDSGFNNYPVLKLALERKFISNCKKEEKKLKECIFSFDGPGSKNILKDNLHYHLQEKYCSSLPLVYCVNIIVPSRAFKVNPRLRNAYEAIVSNPCRFLPSKHEVKSRSLAIESENYFAARSWLQCDDNPSTLKTIIAYLNEASGNIESISIYKIQRKILEEASYE